jgi:hypothetical protein
MGRNAFSSRPATAEPETQNRRWSLLRGCAYNASEDVRRAYRFLLGSSSMRRCIIVISPLCSRKRLQSQSVPHAIFNSMVLMLDTYLYHRSRTIEGRDDDGMAAR